MTLDDLMDAVGYAFLALALTYFGLHIVWAVL